MRLAISIGLALTLGATALAAPQNDAITKAQRQAAIESAMRNRIADQTDIWFDDGDFPRIIQLLQALYEFTPADYEVATDLGWMLENVEQYDAALATYVRYRKENVADPDAAIPEANFYFKRRLFSKVPPILEKRVGPNLHPNGFRILGHSYDRLGMLNDSRRVWKMYTDRYPQDLRAKENLKRVEQKIKQAGGTR
jgi:tetratricopeptide (TPR) repeat protein